MATKETHKQSHDRFYNYLRAEGWIMSLPTLKVRWAEDKYTKTRNLSGYRVWFKSQALYSSQGVTSVNDARSLISDVRGIPNETLLKLIEADRDRAIPPFSQ